MNISSANSLIIAAFLITPTSQVNALTPTQVFDKVKDSIVVVKILDTQGKVKNQGSGVLISATRVATNCHVFKNVVSYLKKEDQQLVRVVGGISSSIQVG